jgi:hypothetical protein
MNEKLNININQLTDSRNQSIINNIIINNNISVSVYRLKPFGLPYWSVNYDAAGANAEIFAGKKIDINAFTHELLHIIEEINGQHSHQTLPTLVQLNSSPFVCILSSNLITHINNVILHERMLPAYLKAGFKKNKFIHDYYNKPKFSQFNKLYFKLENNNQISRVNLPYFLYLFFTYRFHPNRFIKKWYDDTIISKYHNFYPDLVNDLETICNSWTSQTISNNALFFSNLLNTLDSWKTRNNYI